MKSLIKTFLFFALPYSKFLSFSTRQRGALNILSFPSLCPRRRKLGLWRKKEKNVFEFMTISSEYVIIVIITGETRKKTSYAFCKNRISEKLIDEKST